MAKVAEERSAKLEAKKTKFQRQLKAQQVVLQGLRQNLHTEGDKVMSLEEKLRATEEKLLEAALKGATKREAALREAAIEEARLEAVEELPHLTRAMKTATIKVWKKSSTPSGTDVTRWTSHSQ